MITKKAKELRKSIDERKYDIFAAVSNELMEELVVNCKPTKEEFEKYATGLLGSPSAFYNLVMFAKDNWSK